MEWKETARWIKFEENVEDSNRWGKPHVAPLTFHSLLELRKGLEKGMRTGDYFSSLFMLYEVNSSRRENQLYPSRDKRSHLLISSCMNQTLRPQVEPFNSQIKFVILLTVNHTIFIILVQRI